MFRNVEFSVGTSIEIYRMSDELVDFNKKLRVKVARKVKKTKMNQAFGIIQ